MKHCKLIIVLYLSSVPLLSQDVQQPFTIDWGVDTWIFGAAAGTAAFASETEDPLPVLTATEIRNLDKRTINPFDRLTAGWYSKDQDFLSDVLAGGSIVAPLLLVADDRIREDAVTIGVMYAETMILAASLPSFGKGTVRRARPFVYGSPAAMADKLEIDALRSFFSRHATVAFASSVFLAHVYSEYHPDSRYADHVWAGSIGLASTVSLLRVTSGAHFLSDIMVGAAVGSAVGYLVPVFHRSERKDFSLRPFYQQGSHGVTFTLHLK